MNVCNAIVLSVRHIRITVHGMEWNRKGNKKKERRLDEEEMKKREILEPLRKKEGKGREVK